jgi:hypothetical protein
VLTCVGVLARLNTSIAAAPVTAGGPPGTLTIVAAPYVAADYDSRPAVVQAVNNSAGRVPAVASAEIFNQDSRAATTVTLRWYLSLENSDGTVLSQGDSAELPLTPSLEPGASRLVPLELVRYIDVVNQLEAMGRKEGHFRIDVSVAAIKFDNDESWTDKPTTRLDYKSSQASRAVQPLLVKASFAPKAAPVLKRRACTPNYSQCRWVYTGQKYVPCPPPPGQSCGWVATGYWDCGNPHAGEYRCYINGSGGCSMEYCG